jgi:hypothetical protein
MRKWAALEGGSGRSLSGPPRDGCGACPVVVGLLDCSGGEGATPGADGRGLLGCDGCAKAMVANSVAATPKLTVDRFNTILSRPMAVAYPFPVNGDIRFAFR